MDSVDVRIDRVFSMDTSEVKDNLDKFTTFELIDLAVAIELALVERETEYRTFESSGEPYAD